MRVLHLSTHDIAGGAARAAYRVHQCLLHAGLDSRMFVRRKSSIDPTVLTRTDFWGRLYFQLLPALDRLYGKRLKAHDKSQRSFNPAPTFSLRRIRPSQYDVVMIHFVGKGFLTPREVGRIDRPIVWLAHDMWSFSGAEHYSDNYQRFREGYTAQNRPGNQRGADLDRRVWEAKRKHWKALRMTVIGPSRWMSELAKQSQLFANARHGVIPYPLNTSILRPQEKQAARRLFGLPADSKLLLFGAVGALKDQRKGYDLLLESLTKVRTPMELVVFGNRMDDRFDDVPVPCHPIGMLQDEHSLAMLYSAADVMAVPSRMDNLPQTVLESLACGTPCVAFDVGGMPDMIRHLENGYLASPYSTDDFATGIDWVVGDEASHSSASAKAHDSIAANCNEAEIGRRYLELFQSLQNGE